MTRQGGGRSIKDRAAEQFGRDLTADEYDKLGHEFRKGETFLGRFKRQVGEYTLGYAQDALGIQRDDHRSLSVQAFEAANKKRADHRSVTLAGGGFEEAGSAAVRLASTFASREGIDGPAGERPEVTFLKQIAENTRPAAAPPAPPG